MWGELYYTPAYQSECSVSTISVVVIMMLLSYRHLQLGSAGVAS
jgi:hypothetical protein